MIVKQAIPCQAFDVNQPLSASEAASFKLAGYDACIRYIPRTVALIKGNLTIPERDIILNAGLSLMVVQHVAMPGWMPTADLGTQYGSYAGAYSEIIGLPKGMNIWLDLEEVAPGTSEQNVTDYCKAWFNSVSGNGYLPGIYCGYNCGLSSAELYHLLPYKNYWNAYNGPGVAVRGCQIIQHTQKSLNAIDYDPNTIQADNKGDLPMWLSPS